MLCCVAFLDGTCNAYVFKLAVYTKMSILGSMQIRCVMCMY